MATEDTKLVISIETILRGLDKTLRGLSQVEKQLKSVANIKIGGTQNFDKAAAAAQRLRIQEQRLQVQSQNLANAQLRGQILTTRLAQAQERLAQSTQRAANASERAARTQVATERRQAQEVRRIQQETTRQAERQAKIREDAARVLSSVQARETRAGASSFLRLLSEQSQAADVLRQRMTALGNSLRSVGQGLAQVGLTLTATLTAPIIALGAATVNAAVQLDSLKRGLTAIVGSAEEASKQLGRLEQLAKLPGIGFEEAIQGSIRLQAVGFSAAEAEKSLREFANAVALTGGGRDELARVTVQLGQLAAKGKVLSQDLRPIIEAAPAVGRALLEAFGTVNAADIEELGLTSKEFLNTLIESLEKLPRAAAGAKTSFENFRDSVFRAAAAIGEVLLPVLTDLINVAGPVITSLAQGFASLPKPLQGMLVSLIALTAALGPILFISGSLLTGIGRLTVGLAQLGAIGLIPAIRGFLGLSAAAGTAAVSVQASAAAINAALATSLIGLVAVLATVTAGILLFSAATEEAAAIDVQAAKARNDRIKDMQDEVGFLEALRDTTARTADEEKRLVDSYATLNDLQKTRIDLTRSEKEKLDELIVAKRQQLQLDQFIAQATVAQAIREVIEELNKEVAAQEKRAQAQADFDSARSRANIATIRETREVLSEEEKRGVVLGLQEQAQKAALQSQEDLTNAHIEAGRRLTVLGEVTGQTTEELLAQLKAAGANADALRFAAQAMADYAEKQRDAAPEIDDATKAILAQNKALQESLENDPLVVVAESSEKALNAVVRSLQETTKTTDEATRGLQNYIELYPQLKKAVEDAGGIERVVDKILNVKKGPRDTGSQLRNAQENLAQALADIAEESANQRLEIQRLANQRELQENENWFRLSLISFNEYLSQREMLLKAQLQLEIDAQKVALDEAVQTQIRAQKRLSGKLPAAERVRVQAGQKQAEAKAIEIQTRILELTARQREVEDDAAQERAEHAQQQEREVRRLAIEYAELRGAIEAALESSTLERFRERLLELGKDQDTLNKRVRAAARDKKADELVLLKAAQARNQAEIELIRNSIRLQEGLNKLTVTEKLVTQDKERQSELEQQIANDVNFRGLREEEAIRRRLAGEEELRQTLSLARDIIADEIKKIEDLGLIAPEALKEFVRQTELAADGLGRLTFNEQFRLAEKQFSRTQDHLADGIENIERRIRTRDISEIQGRKIIRELNAEYIEQLERQVQLLEQIAAVSNDESLKRQAEAARQQVEDTRAAADELENFNNQLKSVAIDAFADSLSTLFTDLADDTESAAEDIKNFFRNILNQVNQFVAKNLAQRITESLFPADGGGLLGGIKGIFGGGGQAVGGIGAAAGASAPIQAAATALATAGTTAAAALTTGAATSAATETASAAGFSTAIVASAAGFSAAVVAAGVAFAAAVAAAAGAQAIGGAGSSVAGLLGAASGAVVPAQAGGRVIRVAEGGFPEAVLTTDPKFATRQLGILRSYLKQTKGLFGRIPGFAQGGMITAREAELDLLNSISRAPSFSSTISPELISASPSGSSVSFRNINLFDRREMVRGYIRSAEGAQDVLNIVSENAADIGRRIGVR